MPEIMLRESQQRALRALLAADPVPGLPLPDHRLLELVSTMIRCEGVGIVGPSAPDTRVSVGLRWASRDPMMARRLVGHGLVDALLLGCANGPDLVVQLELERCSRPFSSGDVAVLRMLEPALARLFGERPAPHLPLDLTVQERRVLRLVAAGCSNAQVAHRLCIATSTVRKHLEHAFPKLGVTNRFAAAAAFEGRDLQDPVATAPVREYA